MAESDFSNDGDVNLLKESGVRTRGARSRKCPGCHLSHHNHEFGQPHIDCTGPTSNQPESEIDKPCLVPGLSSLDAQIGGASKQPFDLTNSMKEAELDLMADKEKMLLDKLKIMELEEKALQHRHRINELRRRVVTKEKSLRQLEDHIVNPDFGLEDHDNEPPVTIKQQSKSLNNRSLKELVPNLLNDNVQFPGNQIPLTTLLAARKGSSQNAAIMEGFGLNMNMMKTTGKQVHGLQGQDVSIPSVSLAPHLTNVHSNEVCQFVPGSSSNLMDANSQANLLLQPKSGGKCYLKIVDFCDCIIQQDHERTLSDDGHSRHYINYSPKCCKLDVSIPQYVMAAIRILHHLIEGKQIVSYEGIKQYMGYMMKMMELATRFQWVSVLKHDDHFRQLQALHGVPWVFESHHLTFVELLPLPVDISAGSGLTLTRNHKVADNYFSTWSQERCPS